MSVVITCEAHEVVAMRDVLDDIQRWRSHNQKFEDPVMGAVLDVRNRAAVLPIGVEIMTRRAVDSVPSLRDGTGPLGGTST